MPHSHGRCVAEDGAMYFRCEIRRLFSRLHGALRHDILFHCDDVTLLNDRTPFILHTYALREHFGYIVDRLLHALETMQLGLRVLTLASRDEFRYDIVFDPSINLSRLRLDVMTAGDSTLHYIGALLDDIARLIPFAHLSTREYVWFESQTQQRCDGFTAAARLAKGNSRFSYLCDLFQQLDSEDSWWSLGFRFGEGSRQRIVHYTDWTAVAPKAVPIPLPDEDGPGPIPPPPAAALYITRPAEDSSIDFEDRLRAILFGLCEWLDALENRLVEHWPPDDLEPRAPWLSKAAPLFNLPVAGGRNLSEEDDFYLPDCKCP